MYSCVSYALLLACLLKGFIDLHCMAGPIHMSFLWIRPRCYFKKKRTLGGNTDELLCSFGFVSRVHIHVGTNAYVWSQRSTSGVGVVPQKSSAFLLRQVSHWPGACLVDCPDASYSPSAEIASIYHHILLPSFGNQILMLVRSGQR